DRTNQPDAIQLGIGEELLQRWGSLAGCIPPSVVEDEVNARSTEVVAKWKVHPAREVDHRIILTSDRLHALRERAIVVALVARVEIECLQRGAMHRREDDGERRHGERASSKLSRSTALHRHRTEAPSNQHGKC